MSAYVVVEIEVTDPVVYEEYKKLAQESVAKFGGRYAVRGGRTEQFEGDRMPARFVMLEFPTVARAKEWFASEDYARAREVRLRSANANMFVVEGM